MFRITFFTPVPGTILGLLALVSLLLTGCAQTRVTSVWLDREYQGDGIAPVFVVGMADDGGLRRIFEDEFVEQFEQRGVTAIASYRVLPGVEIRDVNKLDGKVVETGSDTILMTRLIDIRKETQYVPPDYVYAPPLHDYRGWHRYYRAYMVRPGYTVEYKTAVLETNLFDLKTDMLIWSARSDTPADGDINRHIKDFAGAIISKLAEAGLIQ